MSPDALAALYARAFPSPLGWSAEDFRGVLATPGAFLVQCPHAFALGRVAADEVELILIATDPERRRRGLARRMLREFEAEARARGAVSGFLEVNEANAGARALYVSEGWCEVAWRENYYGGEGTALVLRKELG